MMKPSSKQLDAIIKLANVPEFVVFLGWLKASRISEAIDSVDTPTEPMRSWKQGRVQQLGMVLDIVKNAEVLLPKVQRDETNRGD